MTTHANDLLFQTDDIRSMVIRARLLGLRRDRVLTALTRHRDGVPLPGMEVRRIFDEEWPAENDWHAQRRPSARAGM